MKSVKTRKKPERIDILLDNNLNDHPNVAVEDRVVIEDDGSIYSELVLDDSLSIENLDDVFEYEEEYVEDESFNEEEVVESKLDIPDLQYKVFHGISRFKQKYLRVPIGIKIQRLLAEIMRTNFTTDHDAFPVELVDGKVYIGHIFNKDYSYIYVDLERTASRDLTRFNIAGITIEDKAIFLRESLQAVLKDRINKTYTVNVTQFNKVKERFIHDFIRRDKHVIVPDNSNIYAIFKYVINHQMSKQSLYNPIDGTNIDILRLHESGKLWGIRYYLEDDIDNDYSFMFTLDNFKLDTADVQNLKLYEELDN